MNNIMHWITQAMAPVAPGEPMFIRMPPDYDALVRVVLLMYVDRKLYAMPHTGLGWVMVTEANPLDIPGT